MRHIRRCLKGKLVLQIGLMALTFYAFGCASQPSAPPTSQADAVDRVSTETQQLQDIQVVDQDSFGHLPGWIEFDDIHSLQGD